MSEINSQLATYLKQKHGLDRLMMELKRKYISLSHPSGTIIINNINKEERIDIGDILGKRILEGSNLKTSFKEITKKINQGKYNGFEWEELLNIYFNEEIITNKKRKEIVCDEKEKFYKEIFDNNKDRLYINKLNEIISSDDIGKIISSKYNKNKKDLRRDLENIFLLLDNIPSTPTPLAVYSSITGNPHYLDLNKSKCNLFLRILAYIKNIEYSEKTEEKINLLSEINVYTDPISNYVITYKLLGDNILDELEKRGEIVNLNLLNIINLDVITTINKCIFIFENPSLLTSLSNLNVPILITSGMPNISFYTLLNKLDKDNKLYYNGDFDPEGLLIAQKLKDKFPKIELFCYSSLDYISAKSKESITPSRLKKLDNVNDMKLQEVKKLLLENKISGYQEQNLDRIKEFIINKLM